MTQSQIDLLKTLCSIHAPSGNEEQMTSFILSYIENHSHKWKVKPVVHAGEDFQDCVILIFGKPRTAVFAHLDSIGFTVRYGDQLVKIGGPALKDGFLLTGEDSKGKVECSLVLNKEGETITSIHYDYIRDLDRGTELVFKANFREDAESVQCCYLDNRLGVLNALNLCEDLENGAIVFSCYEEHKGGTAGFLGKFIQEKYKIRQALISDITWVTEGVTPGKGTAVSFRDSGIPRRKYLNKVKALAEKSGIPFQIEVESSGGSDGNELQHSSVLFDWCFIGAPEENVHTPDEKVNKADIDSMFSLYKYLMKEL